MAFLVDFDDNEDIVNTKILFVSRRLKKKPLTVR